MTIPAIRVLGVYPLAAQSDVHLIEVEIKHPLDFDFGMLTQPLEGLEKSSWQVPYDEQPVVGESNRYVFFFHHLDVHRPLAIGKEQIPLPTSTPVPEHLTEYRYTPP